MGISSLWWLIEKVAAFLPKELVNKYGRRFPIKRLHCECRDCRAMSHRFTLYLTDRKRQLSAEDIRAIVPLDVLTRAVLKAYKKL